MEKGKRMSSSKMPPLRPIARAMAVASAKTALQVWDDPEARELVMEYVKWVWERRKEELKDEPEFKELVKRGGLPP